MKELCYAKGKIILCENGHEVADVLRDLHRGDEGYSTAFGNYRQNQRQPKVGEKLPLMCYCGGVWFDKHELYIGRQNEQN